MTAQKFYKDNGRMPSVGSRVRVKDHGSYKKVDVEGRFGHIRSNAYAAYGKLVVALDDMTNGYSATGYFYFKPHELEIIDECCENETNMEEKNMSTITNYMNIAKVRYVGEGMSSRHDFANFDPDLKEGDMCVVMGGLDGMDLAIVTEIIDCNDTELSREVVAKVDTFAYDERVKVRKEAAELKAKMQERAKKLQDIAVYQMLAKEDSEMQELLARFQSLPQL